jgi:hypothetical protein
MTSRLTDAIAGILDRQGIENGGVETPVPGLRLIRTYGVVPPRHMTYRPSLCLIAQAAKRVMVGDSTLTYGHMQSLVITVEVPVLSEIIEATPEKPFIGATLALRELMPLVRRVAGAPERVRVVTGSQLTPEMLKGSDIVYVGYLSALRLLQAPLDLGSAIFVGSRKRTRKHQGDQRNDGNQWFHRGISSSLGRVGVELNGRLVRHRQPMKGNVKPHARSPGHFFG